MSSVRLSQLMRDPDKRPNQRAAHYIDIIDNVAFSGIVVPISKLAEDVLTANITLPEKFANEIQLQLGNDKILNSRSPDDSIIVQTTIYKDSLDWKSSVPYESAVGGRNTQIPTTGPKILMEMSGTVELKLMFRELPGVDKCFILRGKVISAEVSKCGNGSQWF